MLDIAERLKRQNNGRSWIDCNDRPKRRFHFWFKDIRTVGLDGTERQWWKCRRCPVATVKKIGEVPLPILPRVSR